MPAQLTIATLNTRGVPLTGSQLTARYAAIGAEVDASDLDVVCFQEVLTYVHLVWLRRRLPSFRQVSLRPWIAGPAGGLVTFSRLPLTRTAYHRFPPAPRSPGLPTRSRLGALRSGALVTDLAGVRLVNTHPTANRDGDWTAGNRYAPLHRSQLGALTRIVRAGAVPTVVCGDFNVARDSALHQDFRRESGLADAFGGRCPPTFHAEYLPPGREPHCIDLILVSPGLAVTDTGLLFTTKRPLQGVLTYLSDHIGVRASVRY